MARKRRILVLLTATGTMLWALTQYCRGMAEKPTARVRDKQAARNRIVRRYTRPCFDDEDWSTDEEYTELVNAAIEDCLSREERANLEEDLAEEFNRINEWHDSRDMCAGGGREV